jgi:hypothetical protein
MTPLISRKKKSHRKLKRIKQKRRKSNKIKQKKECHQKDLIEKLKKIKIFQFDDDDDDVFEQKITDIIEQRERIISSLQILQLPIEEESEREDIISNEMKLESIIHLFLSREPPSLLKEEISYLIDEEYYINDILNGILPEEYLNEWVVDDSKTFKSSVKNPPPEINFLLKKAIIEYLVK